MEVGTKQQSLGHKQEAYGLFDRSYELYCLFWGLNMKLLNLEDVKWVEDSFADVKKLTEELSAAETKAAAEAPGNTSGQGEEASPAEPESALAKMKAFVRKAVDCCIE